MLAGLNRFLLAAAATLLIGGASAFTSGQGEIPVANLPTEGQQTLSRIKAGGPFRYPRKDGSTFGNFEKRLPQKPRGYYREYTVPTPGSRDRGARRIIAGEGTTGDVRTSGEYWYTADHYKTFSRIRE